MARAIATKWVATGQLEALSPLHVGSGDESHLTDLPLAMDGQGNLYVPGTSIAGVLRQWLFHCYAWREPVFENGKDGDRCNTATLDTLKRMWGYQPEPGAQDDDHGSASHVFVENAPVELPDACAGQEVWDAIAIDREFATAAAGFKFDRAVLPVGTKLALTLSVELPPDDEEAERFEALLHHTLEALANGDISLGAGTTRGLGRMQLTERSLERQDWSKRADLLAWLETDQWPSDRPAALNADSVPPPKRWYVDVEIDWAPIGPLMVKASGEGVGTDMLPRMAWAPEGQLTLVLPGSSTKGVFRTQAERIVRTVLELRSTWPLPSSPEHSGHSNEAEQLDERMASQLSVPLVTALFGFRRKSRREEQQDVNRGGASVCSARGALDVHTCFASNVRVDAEQWERIATHPRAGKGEDENLYDLLTEAKLRPRPGGSPGARFDQATHVAVDRFTGAAAKGALYTAFEPYHVAWEPLCLRLHLDRLPSASRRPALALLCWLLRDFEAGKLPLGFGTNRGYGEVAVNKTRMSFSPDVASLYGMETGEHDVSSLLASPFGQLLGAAWRGWIQAQGAEGEPIHE